MVAEGRVSCRITQRLSELCSHLVALEVTGDSAPDPIVLYLEEPVLKLSGVRKPAGDIIGKSLIDRAGQTCIDLRTELL